MCVCDSAVSGFLSGSGFFLAQSFEEGKKSSQSFMLPFDPLTVKHQFGLQKLNSVEGRVWLSSWSRNFAF
jgi:hypothetical protein